MQIHPLLALGIFAIAFAAGSWLVSRPPITLRVPMLVAANTLGGVIALAALRFLRPGGFDLNECVAGVVLVLAFVNILGGLILTRGAVRIFRGDR